MTSIPPTRTATRGGTPAATTGAPGVRALGWFVLRQHRTTAWIALALFLAFAGSLVWLHGAMSDFIDTHQVLAACDAVECEASSRKVADFRSSYGDYLHYTGLLLEFLPALLAAFVAGPMVARELESGTYKVAWSQSVSPMRWFAAKLALPAVVVLAGVSVLAALYTWCWRVVGDREGGDVLLPDQVWHQSFNALGPAPVVLALAGVAVGALVGLLLKRTLRAMIVALLATGAVTAVTGTLRQYLITPVTTMSADMPGLLGYRTWWFERGMVGPGGGHIVEPDCGIGVSPAQCLVDHGASGWYVDSHPYTHLWPMQWVQAGGVTVLAVLLAVGALWWMRRTHS
ncbi:hypothetical protein ACFWAT_13175 [Streptomyces syringium]|uniref:hypothetical protein n=1 Tax=Streptomyces syringium TaxID=76729 RepID=UPI003661B732